MICAKQPQRTHAPYDSIPENAIRLVRTLPLRELAKIAAAADCVIRARRGQLVLVAR